MAVQSNVNTQFKTKIDNLFNTNRNIEIKAPSVEGRFGPKNKTFVADGTGSSAPATVPSAPANNQPAEIPSIKSAFGEDGAPGRDGVKAAGLASSTTDGRAGTGFKSPTERVSEEIDAYLTAIGNRGQGVKPGFLVNTETGEMFDTPRYENPVEEGGDESVGSVDADSVDAASGDTVSGISDANSGLSTMSAKDRTTLARERARAKNNGIPPTQAQIKAELDAMDQEARGEASGNKKPTKAKAKASTPRKQNASTSGNAQLAQEVMSMSNDELADLSELKNDAMLMAEKESANLVRIVDEEIARRRIEETQSPEADEEPMVGLVGNEMTDEDVAELLASLGATKETEPEEPKVGLVGNEMTAEDVAELRASLDAAEEMTPEEETSLAVEHLSEVQSPLPDASEGEKSTPKKGAKAVRTEAPPADSPTDTPQEVYSRLFQRIVKARRAIRAALAAGEFWLSGSRLEGKGKKKTLVHSEEVVREIQETCKFFGQKYNKKSVKVLFTSFQVYRAYSLDRDQMIFKKKPNEVKISDQVFIEFLREIRRNTEMAEHPFAYLNQRYKIPGTDQYRFPLPVTPGMAEWFTNPPSTGNRVKLSYNEFVRYSMATYTDVVLDAIMSIKTDPSQRESVLDIVDVIAEAWGDSSLSTIQARDPHDRIAASEFFDFLSDVAKEFNSEESLVELAKSMQRETELSLKHSSYAKAATRKARVNEDEADLGFFRRALRPRNAVQVAKMTSDTARFMALAGMVPLAATGRAELAGGVVGQSWGQDILNMTSGNPIRKNTPAYQERAQLIDQIVEEIAGREYNKTGLFNMMGVLSSKGPLSLVAMAEDGVDFTREVEAGFLESWRERVVKWSVGDGAFEKAMIRLFVEHMVYQSERTQTLSERRSARAKKLGLPEPVPTAVVKPDQILGLIQSDPSSFWKHVARSRSMRAALRFANDASLSGTDPISGAFQELMANPIADLTFGFLFGFFMKYGIRSWLRSIPLSMTATYMVKMGMINPARMYFEGQGRMDSGLTAASNERIAGGIEADTMWSKEGMAGLGQVLALDIGRLGTQILTYAFVFSVVAAMGGVEPPDDDELDHLWYEWKIGEVPIKDAWYWSELLGFSMPLIVSLHAYNQTGDMAKAKQIFWNGLQGELEEGAWMNVVDTIDLLMGAQHYAAEAIARSEGYLGENEASEWDYATTAILTFLARRGYQAFEPAIVRALYNEAGLDWGREKLDHSTNVVYTQSTEDAPDETVITSWTDAQFRRMAYNSPGMGFALNLLNGFYIDNEGIQKTGYMRNQMPLVVYSDPFQSEMIRDLLVMDETGEYVPYEKWPLDRKAAIANLVLGYINDDDPVQIAADGIAIPYDARKAAKEVLDEQWGAAEDEYLDRLESGEFWSSVNGLSYEENELAKNNAWAEKEAKQEALYKLGEKLWSDDIPYAAAKYNRWSTTFRPLYRWKEGTPKAGQPATKWEWRFNKEDVEFSVYTSGDHKSTFMPFSIPDDRGENTYDYQTPLSWVNEYTRMDRVEKIARGNKFSGGMFEGEDVWSVISGDGLLGSGSSEEYDALKLVVGQRALIAAEVPFVKPTKEDKTLGQNYQRDKSKDKQPSWPTYGYRGGGGNYSPNIYSRPGYNLNVDKAAGLYSKTPNYTRYDYLRPSVATKGSREAYRREDF